MKKYLHNLGLRASQNILVHSSFRRIRAAFQGIAPEEIVKMLKDIITPQGSIIFPAFTYNYKKLHGENIEFDRENSQSKVGALSECFRTSSQVVRTSSSTHSFSLWGKAASLIDSRNSPASPLGYGSVMDWMARIENSFVLLIGVNFTALTLGHYIENTFKSPYLRISPWNYLNILPFGISINEEQKLEEIPGCSKSFTRFEKYLLKENFIQKFSRNGLESYYLPIKPLIHFGIDFLKSYPTGFLCKEGQCQSCDERHRFLSHKEISK